MNLDAEHGDELDDTEPMRTSYCHLCPWHATYVNLPTARLGAIWHVFDDHPDRWTKIHGDKDPASYGVDKPEPVR